MSKIRVRQRGKTFSYNFEISKNPRRQKEKGGFATRQEAYDAGIAAYTDWKSGNIGITSERVTLKDYLAAWLETVRPNIKRATLRSRDSTIRARINPFLGEVVLQELRPRDIDLWMNELAKKGLSHSTIAGARNVLSTALKYAVYPVELIATNPATGLFIPRSAPRAVVTRTIITAAKFAEFPSTCRYYSVLKLLYHTGMRIGETLGLTWDDIDMDSGKISVSRQLHEAHYFGTPKTEDSTRTFYADETLLAYLRKLKARQKTDEMRLGEAYQLIYEDPRHDRALLVLPKKLPPPPECLHRSLVCRADNGLPFTHSRIASFLARRGLNAHSFRHTHATRLIEAGAKPVDVAARLGHKDATITQNLYTHDTEAMQKETARIFGTVVDK